MQKVIEKLDEQFEKTCRDIVEKGLTTGNLDEIFKLTTSIRNLERMCGEDEQKDIIQQYSNGRYDHNIDALYDAYIEAKRKYKKVGDQGHRDKVMECVGRLMTEIYDMLSALLLDADFREEKEEAIKRIRMLADM